MDKDKILNEIFSNDPFGLLNVKPKSSNNKTPDERLLASFNEIIDFIDKNGREPESTASNILEFQLYSRLKNIIEDNSKVIILKSHDIYNILPELNENIVNEPKPEYSSKVEINSLDDIFEDESFKEMTTDEERLFVFNHTPKHFEREEADFVARRKPCKNFHEYEPLFKQVQQEIKEGKRSLIAFKQDNLIEGEFYVHNGVLLYLEKVDFQKQVQNFQSGNRIRIDGRTRSIFENGTESQMLYRSLYKILLSNGKAITATQEAVNIKLQNNFNDITAEDQESGFIYILKSLSTNEKISSIDNLYKIGFSTIPLEERIKNAEKEPTYLMAPVKIVSAYKCYNMNPQKFEQLIHNFFGKVCLNFDIYDEKRIRHSPREWFIVPLKIIEKSIGLLISGDIVKYQYEEIKEMIITK